MRSSLPVAAIAGRTNGNELAAMPALAWRNLRRETRRLDRLLTLGPSCDLGIRRRPPALICRHHAATSPLRARARSGALMTQRSAVQDSRRCVRRDRWIWEGRGRALRFVRSAPDMPRAGVVGPTLSRPSEPSAARQRRGPCRRASMRPWPRYRLRPLDSLGNPHERNRPYRTTWSS
jgi:hypothetical protein